MVFLVRGLFSILEEKIVRKMLTSQVGTVIKSTEAGEGTMKTTELISTAFDTVINIVIVNSVLISEC